MNIIGDCCNRHLVHFFTFGGSEHPLSSCYIGTWSLWVLGCCHRLPWKGIILGSTWFSDGFLIGIFYQDVISGLTRISEGFCARFRRFPKAPCT